MCDYGGDSILENVYDILHKKNLMFLLPSDVKTCDVPEDAFASSAVAVNLYYEDTLDRYFSYLENIPESVDVYIFSSNPKAFRKIQDFVSVRSNMRLLPKENRGRDVSALLVAFREFAFQYQYICFVHDKKANYRYMEEDTELWIRNLWDNTLKSAIYINNIFGLFERDKKLGLLVPPKPLGVHLETWYINSWYLNFEHAKKLSEKLGLCCDLAEEKPPITLGTVFWCRAEALRKLLQYEWSYEDFPQEPLSEDGTVSHGIERILAYVAQDAGYQTGIVCCQEYGEGLLLRMQKQMEQCFAVLRSRFKIRNTYMLIHFEEQEKAVKKLFEDCERVYLYGAGEYGKLYLEALEVWGITPEGFVVSDGNRRQSLLRGYRVYELHEIPADGNTGFIITPNYDKQDEIERTLLERGFRHYYKGILR